MISLHRRFRRGLATALLAASIAVSVAAAQPASTTQGTVAAERHPATASPLEGAAPSAPRLAQPAAGGESQPLPPDAGAAQPLAVGPRLIPGRDDAAWQPLFAKLAAEGAVRATFTEQRFFPFRRAPVVLHGVMRHAPGRGLSLQYTAPEPQVVIVDEHGLILRDARGRSREMPADPHAPRMDTVLLPVLRFDLPALLRYFDLHAARRGDEWRIDFDPATPELARQLSTVTVFGRGDAIARLEFRRSANERVVVAINRTETHVMFSPEELKLYFR